MNWIQRYGLEEKSEYALRTILRTTMSFICHHRLEWAAIIDRINDGHIQLLITIYRKEENWDPVEPGLEQPEEGETRQIVNKQLAALEEALGVRIFTEYVTVQKQ